MSRLHLRVYDNRSDAPQPTGPVSLDLPADVTDDQIIEEIERAWANRLRPFRIDYQEGSINPG